MASPSIERPGRGTTVRPGRGSSRQTLRASWASHWDSPVTSYYLLVGAASLLLVLGLVMVLSSSSVDSLAAGDSPYKVFLNQAQFALMGLPLMILATRISPSGYRRIAWPALAGAVFLQLLIFTPLAVGTKGNVNWISLGPGLTIQPSEFSKIALAVWLGVVLARKQDLLHDWKHVAIPAGPAVGLVVGLVMVGKDLGTALIFVLLVAGALFVAGVPLRIYSAIAAGTLVLVAIAASTGNRTNRIAALLGGEVADPAGVGYQAKRGLEALGSGGFAGVGLGASREKWSYLPEAHNDFIFAVIGEELGLLGTLLVLLLFAILGIGMVRVIRRHPAPMVKITTAAIGCWIIGQGLINIGVVIGLLPVIGVPLPLVSAGGSALIATMLALGIVISFARDEPGAREALAARPSVVRRSIAVVSGATWRRGGRPQNSDDG